MRSDREQEFFLPNENVISMFRLGNHHYPLNQYMNTLKEAAVLSRGLVTL